MFAKPSCPICGKVFDTTEDVIHHLDQSCRQDHALWMIPKAPIGERADRVSGSSKDDPTTDHVEDAG